MTLNCLGCADTPCAFMCHISILRNVYDMCVYFSCAFSCLTSSQVYWKDVLWMSRCFCHKIINNVLHMSVQSKWTDLWAAKTWQLHHNNAPPHSVYLIKAFNTKYNIPVVCQAPYSFDIAPRDFWPFPKLIMLLNGTQCKLGGNMQNAMAWLLSIP